MSERLVGKGVKQSVLGDVLTINTTTDTVGINTSATDGELNIYATASPEIRIKSSTSTSGSQIGLDSGDSLQIKTLDDEDIKIYTNNTKVMTIDNGGGVLIGSGSALANSSISLELSSVTQVLMLNRLTTTEKNALTAINGMIVYDSTLGKFQGYEAGAWVSLI